MIDIGLTKIAIIGVVALLVVGPEKLPRVARMAGTLLGRAQRYMSQVKAEVSREIELDDLRKMQSEVQHAANAVQKEFVDAGRHFETTMHAAEDAMLARPEWESPTPARQTEKARIFRKKKLSRTTAIPTWYKRKNGHKAQVLSASARVARYRPAVLNRSSSSFFH